MFGNYWVKIVTSVWIAILLSGCMASKGEWYFLETNQKMVTTLNPFVLCNNEENICTNYIQYETRDDSLLEVNVTGSPAERLCRVISRSKDNNCGSIDKTQLIFGVANINNKFFVETRFSYDKPVSVSDYGFITFIGNTQGPLKNYPCDDSLGICEPKAEILTPANFSSSLYVSVFFFENNDQKNLSSLSANYLIEGYNPETVANNKADKQDTARIKTLGLKEKLDRKVRAFIDQDTLYIDGFPFSSGDVLFLEQSKGDFKKVTLEQVFSGKVKIRYSDGVSDWVEPETILSKNNMEKKAEIYRQEEEYLKRQQEYAEQKRTANCCCKISSTNFWDITLYSRKWISTPKCNAGWDSWTSLGGGAKNVGYCEHHNKNSCDEF